MCGFVVFAGEGDAGRRATVVQSMLATLHHRGPDDEGFADDELAALGFRRLSILDLTAHGHQPMTSADGRYTIVFNGEIFNYLELRSQLQAAGHRFESSGDTEVLLHAYAEWGPACLVRLNGMWAFVIIDRVRRRVFGARDRFGIKPLFRWTDGARTLLASEIKALRASGLTRTELDRDRVADYLVEGGLDDTPKTFFLGIEQVPAAHCFELEPDGRFRQWPYWRLEDFSEVRMTDPVERFATLFEDAIALHMRSDVPVGVHLSGGLDSTAIACVAARVRALAGADTPLMAFSYNDHEFDESPFIADTIAQTGAKLVQLDTDGDSVWRDLPRMLAFQDEPVHSLTAVVGFQLMALTAQHGVRVILNGQGADETLGGYPSFFRDGWMSELARHGLPAAWQEIARYAEDKGEPGLRLFCRFVLHAAKSRLRAWPSYRRVARTRYRERCRALGWVDPALAARAGGQPDDGGADLRSALMSSVRSFPLPIYLRVEDRNSMAHSIEARVPFLDHRLVEFEMALGREWKLDGGLNKVLLRRAMHGRIPDSVQARREKMGFPTPSARWLRTSLYGPVRECIAAGAGRLGDGLDCARLLTMLDQHRDGLADHSYTLFKAVQYLLWLEHGVGTEPVAV